MESFFLVTNRFFFLTGLTGEDTTKTAGIPSGIPAVKYSQISTPIDRTGCGRGESTPNTWGHHVTEFGKRIAYTTPKSSKETHTGSICVAAPHRIQYITLFCRICVLLENKRYFIVVLHYSVYDRKNDRACECAFFGVVFFAQSSSVSNHQDSLC